MAARKLKVFQAQMGFYDTVVAASSQAAALRAWGTRQNLFASGDAALTTEASAVAAALKHPDVPLRRAVGSKAPFALEPQGLPILPKASQSSAPKGASAPKAAATPSKRPPSRDRLGAAERALNALEEERRRQEAGFRSRQEDLDAEKIAAQQDYVRRRQAAKADLEAAKTAYRREGGRD